MVTKIRAYIVQSQWTIDWSTTKVCLLQLLFCFPQLGIYKNILIYIIIEYYTFLT